MDGKAEADRLHRRQTALRLFDAALRAAEPGAAIRVQLARQGSILSCAGVDYDLEHFERIFVIGAGKATAPMAQAVEAILGERLTRGIVCVKYGYSVPTNRIVVEQAGHPIPDENGLRATARMIELARQAGSRDLVVCLLSGGGSALLIAPAEGIALADQQDLTDRLLRSGATIGEINVVRKHLSGIKGGQLIRLAEPAAVLSLIVSDVLGDPLDVISSGPTVPDPTTFADAWRVLQRYELADELPEAIARRLGAGLRGEIPETPKPGNPSFGRVQNLIVASNRQAVEAAATQARRDGYSALVLSTSVDGEAREVARVFAAVGRELVEHDRPVARPAAIIAGGETTVTVRGPGRGGRNQELALAAALALSGLPGVTIMAAATDGSDGPTSAAGAIVDGTTVARARALGLDPLAALAANDSHTFFERLGDLVVTGPTNTNVDDLYVVVVD